MGRKIRAANFLRFFLAISIPLLAFVLQWVFWPVIRPYVWFLFYPAVFFSSWVGGLIGGLAATVISALLVWYYFIPPPFSFALEKKPMMGVAIGVFTTMGILFSLFHGRLRKANRQAAEALAAARNANEKITRLYDQIRELDELKTQFFANVSHELRTPIALILGPVAKRLSAGNLTDGERWDLEVVERNAQLLSRHVNDLLDLAKLDAGGMRLCYAETDLAQAVRILASFFETLAEERRIRYTVTTLDTLPAQVDVEKCRRILLNLLSNAFKFTPVGGTINVDLHMEDNRAVFEVRDSGQGVPAAQREAIFERFRQVEGGPERRFGGTGLGLAIVKEFVGLHRGVVEVADAPGGGTLFTVTLPVKAPDGVEIQPSVEFLEESMDRQTIEELRGQRTPSASPLPTVAEDAPLVLVVEDNPDMNAFLTEAFGRDYRVATAFNGQEGLNKAMERHPDLIVCDVMMPGTSGVQMIEELRRHPHMNDVPIVVLSAKAEDELRVRLLREGVQDYLNKPFSTEELLARAGRLLSERKQAAAVLRESEERLSGLIWSAMDAIVAVDGNHRVVLFNPAAERLFQRKATDVMGQPVDALIPERFRSAHREQVKRFTMDGVTARRMGALGEIYGLRADGQEVVLEASISQAESRGDSLYTVILRDITARKQAKLALQEANQRLRELAGALQDAEEAERKRLARELHDDLGQHLLALRMDLAGLAGRIEREPPASVSATLHDMEKLLDATVQSVRRIISDLRPAILDDLGLSAALEWLIEDFMQRSGISCSAEIEEDGMDIDDRRATAVFRITQEALTNIWRHAGATQARLSLKEHDHSLVLTIDDNGKGITDEAQRKPQSFGLRGMRERVALFGGTLAITRTAEAGTRIEIALPLPEKANRTEEDSIHD